MSHYVFYFIIIVREYYYLDIFCAMYSATKSLF